ncbi:MAG: DinB family protein [Phycisphaerales bacterium]|nr:DinB family protein [Phycisphaerales bacterium]
MNAEALVARLAAVGEAVPALVGGLADADVRWKPAPEHWSILEVACHMADEETEDFRARVGSTLRDPAAAWPPLDLKDVAQRRGYNTRDPRAEVAKFVAARRESVAWLRSLRNPDWSRTYVHRSAGPLSAGDLLASWAAHDALHLRQIAKRLHGLAALEGKIDYAGQW